MRDLNSYADSGKLPDNLPAANATAGAPGMKMRGMAEQKGIKHVIAVMSGKGGVGKSLIATNLAVAMARQTRARVALVDLDLQFGDIGMLLNLDASHGITDLIENIDHMDRDFIEQIMVDGPFGLKVLLAPIKPEQADLVMVDHVRRILGEFRNMFDYIVVDTYPSFADTTLAVFDAADRILVLMTLEMTSLKNIRLFLEVTDKLRYPKDKVAIVVNRFDRAQTIKMEHIEGSLRRTVDFRVSNNPTLSTLSINQGVPYVQSSRDSQLAHEILDIAGKLTRSSVEADAPDLGAPRPAPKMSTRFSFLGRRG